MGKTDNSTTRQTLQEAGLFELYKSPVYGNWFTGNISVRSTVTGPFERVPVHNDYLQLAMSSGIIGLTLFLLVLASLLRVCMRLSAHFEQVGSDSHRDLSIVLALGISAYAIVAGFNPVMFDAGNGLVFGLMSGAVLSLRRVSVSTSLEMNNA